MKMGKTLSTIAALGVLTLAGCNQRQELESPRTGKLSSGLRYVTWTKPNSNKGYNGRVIAFCDGSTVELLDHDGTKTLAGDYLQRYDIKKDGKLLLLEEVFKELTDPNDFCVNANHWREIAIGDSSARAEVISNTNAFYKQIGSKRRVYEGSPDIPTANKRRLNQNK